MRRRSSEDGVTMLRTTTTNPVQNDGLDYEDIAEAIHRQFEKCNVRPSNPNQYTVLAGFALFNSDTYELKVPALATGAKCLPTSRYPSRGDTLHDSHAEVLARRSFVRWLYEEVNRTRHTSGGSPWLERDPDMGRLKLKDCIKLYMYVSTVPCAYLLAIPVWRRCR